MRHRLPRYLILIVAIVVGLGLIAMALVGRPVWQPEPEADGDQPQPRAQQGVKLLGRVEAARIIEIKAPITARVVALGASEGSLVPSGQLILQFASQDAQDVVKAAHKRLRAVQGQVQKVQSSDFQPRMEQARSRWEASAAALRQVQQQVKDYEAANATAAQLVNTVQEAEAVEKSAREALAKAEEEYQQARTSGQGPRLVSLEKVEHDRRMQHEAALRSLQLAKTEEQRREKEIAQLMRLRRNLGSAEQDEARLRRELQALRGTSEGRTLEQAETRLAEARKAVREAEELQAKLAVTAPQAGRLVELNSRPGQVVKAGQQVAALELAGGTRLVLDVPAALAAKVKVGQRLRVTPQDGRPFSVTVTQIAEQPQLRAYVAPLGKVEVPAPGTALVAEL